MKKFLFGLVFVSLLLVFHFFAPVALADGTITVKVNLSPSNDTGKFNLHVGPVTSATDQGNDGSTGPVPAAGSWDVSETAGSNTNLNDYIISLNCSDGTNTVASGSTANSPSFNVSDGENITCTFTNTFSSTSINVKVNVSPSSDSGKFNLLIGPSVRAADQGNGGGTGSVAVGVGTWDVSETAGSGTTLSDYSISLSCSNGTSSSSANSPNFNLNANQSITCTFTNTNPNAPTDTPVPTPTTVPTLTPIPTASTSNSSTSSSSSTTSTNNAQAPVCNSSKPGSAPYLNSAVAGENSVTLTWSEAAAPVSYYLVAYGLSSGSLSYGNPNVGGAGTTSYTVSGLSGGTKYYFKVRAGNGCMPGDYSNELSATPGGTVVTTPAAGFVANVLGAATQVATPTAILTQVPQVKGAATTNTSDENLLLKYKWFLIAFLLLQAAIIIYYEKRFSDLKKRISQ